MGLLACSQLTKRVHEAPFLLNTTWQSNLARAPGLCSTFAKTEHVHSCFYLTPTALTCIIVRNLPAE